MFWWELPFNHHQVPWEPEPNVFFKLERQHETSHSKGPWNPWNSVDAEWDKCGLGGNCRKSPCSQWIAMGMFVDDESLNHIKGWWMFRGHYLMSLRTTENWFLKMNVFFDKALSQICFHGKVAETTTVNNKHRDCQNCWGKHEFRHLPVERKAVDMSGDVPQLYSETEKMCSLVCWLFGSPPHVPAWRSSRSLCKFSPSS